ncbi:IS1595 family transposase [Paenibacillus eucommiae]|uniref:Transposase-like protein n=1 Tax=Paenibacillus eucommiae TaxID=1355755 RepID=A0ABS4IY31_9BACL|nr:IS1595 family transposase [Paenibacillus eucommiae]MBP1992477.1 transposase-like protein [Paenibacillus eucommiae]
MLDKIVSADTTLAEFSHIFDSEETCSKALFTAKWPEGFRCPRCGYSHAYTIISRRLPLYECRDCRHQTSLISNTVIEGSRTSLMKWFLAFFLIARTDQGTNAVELSSILGVTYKTAWLILTKIRFVMSQADEQAPLSGIVQINSAFYGRPYNPTVLRHPQEQPLLVGSSVNQQGESIYIKMKKISVAHMRDKSVLRSGTEAFYEQHIDNDDTTHVTCVTARFSFTRFKGLLQTAKKASKWINDTFHGLGSKHLQGYLDEFCYRLNLTLTKSPIFHHLTSLCANSPSITYAKLISQKL